MNYAKHIGEKHLTGAAVISALVVFDGPFDVPSGTSPRDWAVFDGESQDPQLRRVFEDRDMYRLRLLALRAPSWRALYLSVTRAHGVGLTDHQRQAIRDATDPLPVRRTG